MITLTIFGKIFLSIVIVIFSAFVAICYCKDTDKVPPQILNILIMAGFVGIVLDILAAVWFLI